MKNVKVHIEICYNDESEFSFTVIPNSESQSAIMAEIMMITRGTLMASSATKATAYNEEGFPLCSYIK